MPGYAVLVYRNALQHAIEIGIYLPFGNRYVRNLHTGHYVPAVTHEPPEIGVVDIMHNSLGAPPPVLKAHIAARADDIGALEDVAIRRVP
jgi:hypothetical protein